MSTTTEPQPSNQARAARELERAAAGPTADSAFVSFIAVGYALLAIADAIYEHAYSTAPR